MTIVHFALEKLTIKPRPFTNMLKRVYGNKPLVGCEIGVLEGRNAKSLLEQLNLKGLYLVDIDFSKLKYLTKKDHSKVMFRIGRSDEVYNGIFEELDFVYIDGSHVYPDVMSDIVHYTEIVKDNGFVGGHNFDVPENTDVVYAVGDYCRKNNIELNGRYPDWWFQKK